MLSDGSLTDTLLFRCEICLNVYESSKDQNLSYILCETKFTRKDNLQRHIKIKTDKFFASYFMSYVGCDFSAFNTSLFGSSSKPYILWLWLLLLSLSLLFYSFFANEKNPPEIVTAQPAPPYTVRIYLGSILSNYETLNTEWFCFLIGKQCVHTIVASNRNSDSDQLI